MGSAVRGVPSERPGSAARLKLRVWGGRSEHEAEEAARHSDARQRAPQGAHSKRMVARAD